MTDEELAKDLRNKARALNAAIKEARLYKLRVMPHIVGDPPEVDITVLREVSTRW